MSRGCIYCDYPSSLPPSGCPIHPLTVALPDWEIGTAVVVCKDNGFRFHTKTRGFPYIMGGVAVIHLEGISGCYSLERTMLDDPQPDARVAESELIRSVADDVVTRVCVACEKGIHDGCVVHYDPQAQCPCGHGNATVAESEYVPLQCAADNPLNQRALELKAVLDTARDVIARVMKEGEATHAVGEWRTRKDLIKHAKIHVLLWFNDGEVEDLEHALTDIALALAKQAGK